MFGDEARLEHAPEPQRHVGIFGGILRRPFRGYAIKGDPGFARASDRIEVDIDMIKVAPGQWIKAVIRAARIEHIGHQHRVVAGRGRNAAQGGKCVILGNLVLRDRAGKQAAANAVAAFAMGERHVTGLVGGECEREATQYCLHGIKARRLSVDGDHAQILRARNPGLESVKRAHGLIK